MQTSSTPLDFYLCIYVGRIEEIVYQNNIIENIQDLRLTIIQAFDSLEPEEIRAAAQFVQQRIEICRRENGEHFEHFL